MVNFSSMKKRYYIKDVIKELGICRKSYYLWESAGKIPPARRDRISRYRFWTADDLRKLKKITGRE